MSNFRYQISNESGQSLIEAIIAIAIATVGFIGIATLLAQSLHIAKAIADQETATYLASEGIELSKNMLDHDANSRFGAWGTCFDGDSGTGTLVAGGAIELDFQSTKCNRFFNFDPLYYDPVTHFYGYANDLPARDNPIKTSFTREIDINAVATGVVEVRSIVRWSTGGFSQNLELVDYFYDWRP